MGGGGNDGKTKTIRMVYRLRCRWLAMMEEIFRIVKIAILRIKIDVLNKVGNKIWEKWS